MKPLTNKRKNFNMDYILSQNFKRFRDLSKGSECDRGSENVIILAKSFCRVIKGFRYVGYVRPEIWTP